MSSAVSLHAYAWKPPLHREAGNRDTLYEGLIIPRTGHARNTVIDQLWDDGCFLSPLRGEESTPVFILVAERLVGVSLKFCLFREPLIQGFIFLNSFFHDSGHLCRRVVDPILIHVYTSLFSQYLRGSSLKNCTR